jgi:hypothetical protein
VGRLATVKENWSLGALAALLEALRKSNVATYSISTGDFSSAILRKVSVASGGFMMRAANFERDAERLIEDLDHYYLLGFYPDDGNASDKSYRPLPVRVNRRRRRNPVVGGDRSRGHRPATTM